MLLAIPTEASARMCFYCKMNCLHVPATLGSFGIDDPVSSGDSFGSGDLVGSGISDVCVGSGVGVSQASSA